MRQPFVLALVLLAAATAACGDDTAPSTTPVSTPTTVPASVTTTAPSSSTTSTTPSTSSSTTTAPTTSAPATTIPSDQTVAAWPPTGVRFTTPEAVAADFTARAYPRGAVLGAFRAGDALSGEIEVFASDETGRPIGVARSVLLVRELGDRGWTVLAAVSEGATIESPGAGDEVGPLVEVSGRARGFEANVNVRAVPIGAPDDVLDEEITFGGNLVRLRPYRVDLDVSAAAPGDVLLLVVRGGVGLETDPGDTAVIPVVRR